MKYLSTNGLVLCSALLISGIASAAAHNNIANKQNTQGMHNFSYTAHGTTNANTARLLRHLLNNSKALRVTASVKTPKPQRDIDVSVNYTIKGTTSMRNVRKLVQLFKSSKHIQVTARANVRTNTTLRGQRFSFNQPGTWSLNRANATARHYNRHLAVK